LFRSQNEGKTNRRRRRVGQELEEQRTKVRSKKEKGGTGDSLKKREEAVMSHACPFQSQSRNLNNFVKKDLER
jgi:hypothetical protein